MARVTAGLMCAPLKRCEQNTPTNTSKAQPDEMTIQPELWPLVRARTTLATTPLPKMLSNAVPINSATIGFIREVKQVELLIELNGFDRNVYGSANVYGFI